MKTKLTPEEFVLLAIEKLSTPERKTVHTVFSGFNEAFREYFPGGDPVKEVKALVAAGKVSSRPSVRGALIALPGVITNTAKPKDLLKKMGL